MTPPVSTVAAQLATIARTGAVLAIGAIALGGLVWGARGMLAAGAGAALAVADLAAIRWLGARAFDKLAAGSASKRETALLTGALTGKLALLVALVYVALRRAALLAVPFTIGISVLAVAVLVAGLYLGAEGHKLRPRNEAD